jgi:hypothetical protein
MNASNILAHRGFWETLAETNSSYAIRSALEKGFGVETDVRDFKGRLVISHDPPHSTNDFDLCNLFELVGEINSNARIALNIKSDGLQKKLKEIVVEKHLKMENFFVFDMSIPDTLGYRKMKMPFYSRLSEYETELNLLKTAVGAWVDNFSGDFEQIEYSKKILEMGKRVAFVSPELHRREHLGVWREIKSANLHRSTCFEMCTDFPEEAHKFFSEEK